MQPSAIVFPDAEVVVCGVLSTALAARPESFAAGVYVGHTMPAPSTTKPARVVWVQRDGGPRLDQVRDSARMRINVLSDDEDDCADLTRLVVALLWASPDGDPVLRVSGATGAVSVPDENYGYRKFFTCEVLLRGTPLTSEPIVPESSSSSSSSSASSSSSSS